jgi:poly(A) polymerase
VPALQQAIDAVFDARIGDISGRGKLGADMREIWMMQPRFERRQANTAFDADRAAALSRRLRLPAVACRCRRGAGELAEWWEDFSMGTDDEREALLAAVREAQRSGPRRSGSRRGAATADASLPAPVMEPEGESQRAPGPDEVDGTDAAAPDSGAGDAPARKRRRRRRKPAGGATAAADAAGGDDGNA